MPDLTPALQHRTVRSMTELIDELEHVDAGLNALCGLLHAAGEGRMHACDAHVLLQPLRARLAGALEDLGTVTRGRATR